MIDGTLLGLLVSLLVAVLSSWTALRVARIERGVDTVRRSTVEPDGGHGVPLIDRVRTMDEVGEERWSWTVDSVGRIGREVGALLDAPPPSRGTAA